MNPQSNDIVERVNMILDHIHRTGPGVVQSQGVSPSGCVCQILLETVLSSGDQTLRGRLTNQRIFGREGEERVEG